MKRFLKRVVCVALAAVLCCSTLCIMQGSAAEEMYKVKLKSQDMPRITGNFIQPWLFSNWDDKRWRQELDMWKQIGIEYVIMGDTANKTSEGWHVFYDSKLDFLQNQYTDNVVDDLMKYCDMYGIKVILGIGLNTNWYDYKLNTDEGMAGMLEWRATSAQIMDELYELYKTKYPDTLYGWYWVEELYNDVMWDNDEARGIMAKNMATAFNVVLDQIANSPSPEMPLFFSPHVNPHETGQFSGYSCTDLTKVTDFWAQFIRQANFKPQDTLIPQSSVDHCACTIDQLDAWTKFYADAIEASGKKIRFWSNVESFHGNDTSLIDINAPNHAYSRPLDIFVQQMQIVSKYCDTIFNFAYSHFYSPYVVIDGYHKSYLYYLEHGEVEKNKPIGPNKIQTKVIGEGDNAFLRLTWSGMWDDCGVGRINIYKNGVLVDYLINNIGNDAPRTAMNEWTDTDFSPEYSSAIYTIEPIDVSGNIGDKVSYAVCSENVNNGVQLDENFVYVYDEANPLAGIGSEPPEYCKTPIEGNEFFTPADDIAVNVIVNKKPGDELQVSKKAFQAATAEEKDVLIRYYTDEQKQNLAYSFTLKNKSIFDSEQDFTNFLSFDEKDIIGKNNLNKHVKYKQGIAFQVLGNENSPGSVSLHLPIGEQIQSEKVRMYYCSPNGEVKRLGTTYPVKDGIVELLPIKAGSYLIAEEDSTIKGAFTMMLISPVFYILLVAGIAVIIMVIFLLRYFGIGGSKFKKVANSTGIPSENSSGQDSKEPSDNNEL